MKNSVPYADLLFTGCNGGKWRFSLVTTPWWICSICKTTNGILYTRHSCLVDAKFGIRDITALIQSHGQLYLPNNTGRIDGFVSSMRQKMGTRRHLRISKTQDRKPAMISKAHQTRTLYIITLPAPKYTAESKVSDTRKLYWIKMTHKAIMLNHK